MSVMVLDALLSIGDRPDGQVIGRTENIGGSGSEAVPEKVALTCFHLTYFR